MWVHLKIEKNERRRVFASSKKCGTHIHPVIDVITGVITRPVQFQQRPDYEVIACKIKRLTHHQHQLEVINNENPFSSMNKTTMSCSVVDSKAHGIPLQSGGQGEANLGNCGNCSGDI